MKGLWQCYGERPRSRTYSGHRDGRERSVLLLTLVDDLLRSGIATSQWRGIAARPEEVADASIASLCST